MSDSKNSMIFFYDWQNLFEELTDAEIGQLVMAALKYDQSGTDTKFQDKGMRVAFKAMKNSIKVSNEKYQTACEKKREAMERRWKKNRDVYTSIDNYKQSSDTDTDTVTVTVTDTHTVTDTVTDTESGSGSNKEAANAAPPTPPHLSDQDFKVIMDAWNDQCCVREIQGISDSRRKKIQKLTHNGIGQFLQTINDMDNQEYFIDQVKNGKKVEFDWFLEPDNYQKVIEGKYKKSYSKGGGYGLARDW